MGAAAAGAVPTSADFREELGFPSIGLQPRILQKLGQPIGAGPELVDADEISNPDNLKDSIIVDIDPTTLQIILTPTSDNNYQTIDIIISNIVFAPVTEVIGAITPLTDTLIDAAMSGPFTRTIDFTATSVRISYAVNDLSSDDTLEFSDGTAVFNISL